MAPRKLFLRVTSEHCRQNCFTVCNRTASLRVFVTLDTFRVATSYSPYVTMCIDGAGTCAAAAATAAE